MVPAPELLDCLPKETWGLSFESNKKGEYWRTHQADVYAPSANARLNLQHPKSRDQANLDEGLCRAAAEAIQLGPCEVGFVSNDAMGASSTAFVSARFICKRPFGGLKTKDRWVFNPDSTRPKKALNVLSRTYGYLRLPIGLCNSLKLRLCSHS
jgi:hypothetical protein